MLLTYHLSSQRSALRVERSPGTLRPGRTFHEGPEPMRRFPALPLFLVGRDPGGGFRPRTRSEALRAVHSRRGAELLPAEVGDDAAARRALKETELQQERL